MIKKILDVRNIIIGVLIILCIVEFINPKGILPNRTIASKPIIDSIPYPIHDTTPIETEVEVQVPVPYAVHDTLQIPTSVSVDTNLILKDYLAKNEFKQKLELPNKQGTIDLTEVVSKNKIIDRTFVANVKPTIKKDTIYTPIPKRTQFFVGVDGRFNKANVVELLGLGFVLKDKSDRLYKIDVGVTNNVIEQNKGELHPYIGGGVYWKIKM